MKLYPLLCALLLGVAPLAAELPPLPKAELERLAQRIVVVKVLKVTQARIDSPGEFPKVVYEAQTKVESVTQGKGVKAGDKLKCTYWKAGERPAGWAGPGGQYQPLVAGSVVRLYLTNKNELLTPNGWDTP